MQVFQSIYLSLLGFDAASIGVLLSIMQIVSSLRSVLYSMIADRYDRRTVLMIIYCSGIVYLTIFYFSTSFAWFVVAALVAGAGFGGIAGGGVIQQALLAKKSGDEKRTRVFSFQSFMTAIFAAIGNSISGLPELLQTTFNLDVISSIKPLFILGIFLSLAAVGLIFLVAADKQGDEQNANKKHFIPKKSWGLILKFSIPSLFMAIGGGVFFALAPLWFYLTFNIKISDVGFILAVSRTVETFAYLLIPTVSSKTGLVKAIVLTRVGGVMMMACMPLMPNHLFAAILFAARNALLHSSQPLRSSYRMALLDPEEKASAASIINLTSTVPRATATTLGGYLMENVSTTLPVYIGVTMFFIEAICYYIIFHKIRPPEEQMMDKPT